MGTLTLRLPDELDHRLTEFAKAEDTSRSELARTALEKFLRDSERERWMTQLVEEARAGYANEDIRQEAAKIAAEFLPLENEALDVAEGRKPGKPRHKKQLAEKWWK